MLNRAPGWAIVTLLLAGCAASAPSFKEAENLEAQGNFEQAAQKFELVCAEAPAGTECPKAASRAAKALVTAATAAMTKNEFAKAEGLFLRALLDADETTAKEIEATLAKEDLIDGIRYEHAVADTDKQRASLMMVTLSASNSPVAKLAKAWLDKETPGLLVAQVKSACGPDRNGSCVGTFAKLEALSPKPPGFDEAKAAYDAEMKRTEKARAELERFLAVFASRGKKQLAYDKCMSDRLSVAAQVIPHDSSRECNEEAFADGKALWERFDGQQTEENLFRRRLATIDDPGLTASYEERRVQALSSGEVPKKAAGGAP